MRALPPVLMLSLALLVRRAPAQAPDSLRRASGATVSGVVHDSVARAPLAGAWVQLVASASVSRGARTAMSDSLGRFAFDGVSDGRYTLGFFHPVLDSLGIEPPLREVRVSRGQPIRADIAVPSPARMRAAICGATATPNAGAVVVGIVRSARERTPTAGATVTGEWHEISFQNGHVEHHRPRLVVTSAENGWFALCNVPKGGTMFLAAQRGRESTDLIEVQMPADGFLRRELYLGAVRTLVVVDSAASADTLTIPPARWRVGDGRVRGVVMAAYGNRPLGGALVRIADGPTTVANARGEWTITDAPVGSRVLEVRAVGYYPARLPVDVVADAPPVTVSLVTFKAMLDTVRVTAARVADRMNSGFEDRRRSSAGTFLTDRDIARHGALFTSDIFRHVVGVRIGTAADTVMTIMADVPEALTPIGVDATERRIIMRGIGAAWCIPDMYLDGAYFPNMDADALDSWVRPEHLRGIEVYTEATRPAAFHRARDGCGVILIWTK